MITNAQSSNNLTSSPLNDGETFTGISDDALAFSEVRVALKTDINCILYIDQSQDNVNFDSSLPYQVDANINEVHRLVLTRRYVRIRIYNNSGSNQTFLRASMMLSTTSGFLTSPLNSTIQQDAGSIVTRAITAEFAIAQGYFQNWSVVNKSGKNSDIDTGVSISSPAFITEQGGAYSGFIIGTGEQLVAVSTSASDTGTLVFTGLKTPDSEAYENETIILNGTTSVNSVDSFWRCHTMRYDSGNDTTFNVGTITLKGVTSGITYLSIIPNTSQSNYAVFTIPKGFTGYILRENYSIRKGASASVDGALWTRSFGASPRYRRPFTVSQTQSRDVRTFTGVTLSEQTDIAVIVNFASANNIDFVAEFDILLIKN